MIKSANQLYKESKSEVPFKEWLLTQQNVGKLDNHNKMFNAEGNNDVEDVENVEVIDEPQILIKKTPTSTIVSAKNNRILNFVGVVSLGLFLYGLHKATQPQQV